MDVFEAINTRTSVSVLKDPGPTDRQWEILLRAGARAPDHGRLRPWRFLIVRGEARELLGDAMAEALRASKPDTPSEALDRERRKPSRAPAILVVAVVPVPHSGVPEIEQILAGGAAAQNILLAAHALGLGAIWRTGAPAYDERCRASARLARARAHRRLHLSWRAPCSGYTRRRRRTAERRGLGGDPARIPLAAELTAASLDPRARR